MIFSMAGMSVITTMESGMLVPQDQFKEQIYIRYRKGMRGLKVTHSVPSRQ